MRRAIRVADALLAIRAGTGLGWEARVFTGMDKAEHWPQWDSGSVYEAFYFISGGRRLAKV